MIAAPVHSTSEIGHAVDELAREANGGLIMVPDNFTTIHRKLIISLCAHYRLPAIYPFRYIPAEGGLICYGVDVADPHHRARPMSIVFRREAAPGGDPWLELRVVYGVSPGHSE